MDLESIVGIVLNVAFVDFIVWKMKQSKDNDNSNPPSGGGENGGGRGGNTDTHL